MSGDLKTLFRNSGFHEVLGCELTEVSIAESGGTIEVSMPFSPRVERETGSGRFHGGVIAALVDSTGTFALIAASGRNVPTVSLNIHYLRAATGTRLTAQAVVRKVGRTQGIADVEVRQDGGELIALGRVSASMT